MPEIGATLREARMRARIDVSQLEVETKIRAKYLRALENEEWESLPGPTYIKSFLRTYADALGLDGKLLVQEYKARHEHLSETELQPIVPLGARRRQPDERRGGGARRDITVALVIVAIVGALIAVGRSGGGGSGQRTTSTRAQKPRTNRGAAAAAAAAERRRAARRKVRLTLVATGDVYVCLRKAGNRALIAGAILHAGETRGPYRSRRFAMTFGNSAITMRVDGRTLAVPASPGPVSYALTARARRPLSGGARPACP